MLQDKTFTFYIFSFPLCLEAPGAAMCAVNMACKRNVIVASIFLCFPGMLWLCKYTAGVSRASLIALLNASYVTVYVWLFFPLFFQMKE